MKTVSDVRNEFLSRRELVCDFDRGAGVLKKLDAVDAVVKEHSLEGKTVVPIRLQNHVGKTHTTATFFVYDDESLAKKHITGSVLARIEKLKTAKAEAAKPADAPADDAPAPDAPSKEGTDAPKEDAPKDGATASKDAPPSKEDAPASDAPSKDDPAPSGNDAPAQPEAKAPETESKGDA